MNRQQKSCTISDRPPSKNLNSTSIEGGAKIHQLLYCGTDCGFKEGNHSNWDEIRKVVNTGPLFIRQR